MSGYVSKDVALVLMPRPTAVSEPIYQPPSFEQPPAADRLTDAAKTTARAPRVVVGLGCHLGFLQGTDTTPSPGQEGTDAECPEQRECY